MGLTQIVKPQELPVSVPQARKQVEVPAQTTHHDIHLKRLITAATNQVQQRTGRALITQKWRLTLDRFPYGDRDSNNESRHGYYGRYGGYCDQRLMLPRPPLVSVDSITYVDSFGENQTLDPECYKVGTNSSPGIIQPAYGTTWPDTQYEIEAVTIDYTAGYGDDRESIPDEYRQAILIAVDHWFDPDQPMSGAESQGLPGAAMSLIESLHTGVKYGHYGVTE